MIVGMRRKLAFTLAGLAVLALAVAGSAYLYLRRSLPTVDGTVRVQGLSAPIDIVRDRADIPHIFARSKLDALFGLGYVHAQDRLWQMEFQRRIGFGRLSEVLGPAALPQDKFLRIVGFGRAARATWARLPLATRRELDAYVAGINAFLDGHHGSALPPEFTLLRFEPEHWEGPDVVVWQKMLAWDLSANYSFELLRHDIGAGVGPAGLADLMPEYAPNGLSITGDAPAASADSTSLRGGTGNRSSRTGSPGVASPANPVPWISNFAAALSQGNPAVRDVLFGAPRTEALGSNNWVIDGTLTASGKPLLANDPHLTARAPSIWYLAHVSGGDYDAIGATIPGTPAMVLGRNRFIAWGATNVAGDVQDLYREQLDPSEHAARFEGRSEPLQFVPETILVKGREPVRLFARISRHGPLVSDAINAVNEASPTGKALPRLEPLAFRWTALDPEDTTIVAMMRMSEAHNWNEFTSALSEFVVPSQNFVYADVDGHIGYYAPGRFPIRAGGDGTAPVDGWTGTNEWTGWVPFDELPHAFDPPSHMIVTANNRPVPASYPHWLGAEWTEPFRAQRILERLRAQRSFTPDDFASIQADTLSLHARELLPALLKRVVPHREADAQAIRILRRWNYDARADSAAAAIFQAWFVHLVPGLVGDDLAAPVVENYAGRFSFVSRFLLRLATTGTAPSGRDWCDDRRTPAIETCDEIISAALDAGVADLRRQLTGDMERWRWDGVHRAIFPHQGFDTVAFLRPLFSRSVPSGGDWSTVDVGAVAVDHPYEQHAVAGYREIIDLSPANDSRFAEALGQSGHVLSRHYDDGLSDWRAVRHKPMLMDRAHIERDATGHLHLVAP
jgi:penicillin amidase